MGKTRLGIIVVAAVFLFLSLSYCQELSDKERSIFYDAAWLALQGEYQISIDSQGGIEEVEGKMQQLLDQNNLTPDQLKDIIERGNKMPFTPAEEQLVQEMDREITDNLTPDKTMAVLNKLANKYGMSISQVSSVFTRRITRN
jgi:hypothetical protein